MYVLLLIPLAHTFLTHFYYIDNYIVAGALDGGTQVISFILNLAVFGAVGDAHSFPEWWGNDLSA